MTGTGQTLGGIGAMPYVPYTAIELVGDIQLTAFLATGVLVILCVLISAVAHERIPVWSHLIAGFLVGSAIAVFITATFVRIWL